LFIASSESRIPKIFGAFLLGILVAAFSRAKKHFVWNLPRASAKLFFNPGLSGRDTKGSDSPTPTLYAKNLFESYDLWGIIYA
jgi:hypothetical protein